MGKKVLMSPNHSKTTPFLSKNKRAFSDLLDVSGNGRREKRALFPLVKKLLFEVLGVSGIPGNERREIRSLFLLP